MRWTMLAATAVTLAGCAHKAPQTFSGPLPASDLECARSRMVQLGYTVTAAAPGLHGERVVPGHAKYDELRVSMLSDGANRLQVIAQTSEDENGARQLERTSPTVRADALAVVAACGGRP
jgi:hypothetical protein